MVLSASHRIARQTVELRVDTDAAARDLYDELSESFRARVTPVLDEVFAEVCPPDITMRIDRLEIDVGVVTREGLMNAISVAMRDQLAARLTNTAAINDGGLSTADPPQRVTAEEIALERVAAFLEHGVTTWRDASITREVLEGTLLELIANAPAALRRVLERVPPARVARRLWTQLSVTTRHRLFAWLGVTDPAELDRAIEGWVELLAALEGRPGVVPPAASRHEAQLLILERAWTTVVAHRRAAAVADVMGERILSSLTEGTATAEAASVLDFVLVAAERLLPPGHPVIRVVAASAAPIDLERPLDTHGRPLPRRGDAASGAETGAAATPAGRRRKAVRGQSRKQIESARLDGVAANREHAVAIAGAAGGHDPVDAAARQRAIARVKDTSRVEPSARRVHASAGAEPLWVAHAGVVIVWPFLQGYFDACGLTTEKRFVDDAARERAVLLTAYLATGLQEWDEHDLLLEKTLCGHPAGEPIASTIEPSDEERRQATALLESVIGHWAALKATSVDGLRRAFLSRSGTMTEISSAWKLEIPRAGHDVLLDRLPWGFGVVLLPWMEQPLHVEW